MNWTSDATVNNKVFDWGMYKRGRGGVVEEKCETTEVIWKHELRLHRNKIEEVEWRNRSLAAPNPIVSSLSDRPRDDGGREDCFPHPSPWCPVILPLWIISVGYHCKKVVLFPGSVLKRGLLSSKRSFSSQSETNVLASLSRQKCCKKSSLQFNKQFCCQWWPVRTASLEKSYRYRHLINTNFEIHKQVKGNDVISQRYGDLMTLFSSVVSIPG